MQWRTAVFTLQIILVCLAAKPALGVIIFLKGKEEPVRGLLVRENEHVVVINEVGADGTTTERTISRSDIEDTIRTVSPERLEALQPDKPDGYREYAEELAEKSKDPDARLTALRLFLIAADLAPDRLGRSCLLGMVPLARSEAEKRAFRAMAYLLDPTHDPGVLTMPVQSTRARSRAEPEQAQSVMEALRLLRQGKRNAAVTLAGRIAMEEQLPLLTDTITYSEFEEACEAACPHCHRGRVKCPECDGRKFVSGRPCPVCGSRGYVTCSRCGGDYRENPLSKSLLKRIVQLELNRLPDAEPASAPSRPTGVPWSRGVQQGQYGALPPLTLQSLTEFDPSKNVFRDGEWTSL